MKKIILSLLIAAMLPFSAAYAAINEAAQQGAAVVVKGNIGQEKKGVFVTLVVTEQGLSPEDISNAFDTSVYYIDQTESDENGDYYFRIYLPETMDAHGIFVKAGEGKYGTAEKDEIRYTQISLICGELENMNKAYYETVGDEEKTAAMLEALSSEHLGLSDFSEYSDYTTLENKGAVAAHMLDSVAGERLTYGTDDEIEKAVNRVINDWRKAVGICAVQESKNQKEMKELLNRYAKVFEMDTGRLDNIKTEKEYFFMELKRQNPETEQALREAYYASCAFSDINSVPSWSALKETVLADSGYIGIDVSNTGDFGKIEDKDGFFKKLVNGVPFTSLENFKSAFNTLCKNWGAQSGGGNGGSSSGGKGGSNNSSGGIANPVLPVIVDKPPVADLEAPAFEDLEAVAWAEGSIGYLYKHGIVTGVGDKRFEPQRNITRAEFVKMVISAFGIQPLEGDAATFGDVKPDDWYFECVSAGKKAGVISGDENGNFNPQNAISRQDMAVILYRCMDSRGHSFASGQDAFSDRENICGYARDAVEKLCGAEIINGYEDGTFRPFASATRAEVAQVVYNGIMKMEGK